MKSDIRRLAEHLLDESLNHTEVGRLFNKHRDTVRRMRRRANAHDLTFEGLSNQTDAQLRNILFSSRLRRTRCIQPDWDATVQHLLHTGDNMLDYYEDYYLKQPVSGDGKRYMSYSHFAKQLSKLLKRRAPEYRHDYRPGEVMQIDFAGFQPSYTSAGGTQIKCTLLLLHFPFSQYCAGCIIPSQKRSDSIYGLIRIFQTLDGTAKRVILDNFKAAIDVARGPRREAKINPEFRAFLDHYHISPDPTRGGEARDKGAVEGIVKLAQRYLQRILRDQQPRSIGDLNELLQTALDRLNEKVMRRWKTSRAARFQAREMQCLRKLPEIAYDYGVWKVGIKVQRHYRVHVDGRDYSVPFSLIGEAVSIKLTAATVEMYHDSSLVAVHARRIGPPDDDTPVIDPSHMPKNHRAMWRQNPDNLVDRGTRYSPNLGRFIALHLDKNGNPRATYNMLKRLLETASVHGKATIDAACVEAIQRNQIDPDTLRQILARGPLKRKRYQPLPPSTPSENIRGASYYAEGENDAV
ncbi:hypothetical protein [Ruegeria sp.]|uniref:Mu transposase domain-containing protein n=1 Tax=Ruegeria sp. TaxID=1879320 RepID=UPI0023252B91|nr:hypothetical protein [Ruegeria sp.]MDA7966268.1 hypothetical protein [Ruegeria sp.]